MKVVLQQILGAMQGPGDRLAVFCVYCQHPGACSHGVTVGCQLHSLRAPDLAALMHELDFLGPTSPTGPLNSARPAEFWKEVIQLLSQPDADHRVVQPESAQVIVLSPNPQEHAVVLHTLKPWPVHQIRCGLL